MQGKSRIDERYPLPSEWRKFFMLAYALAIFPAIVAGKWEAGWFWALLIFGGLPWLGAIGNYFHTTGCREGYLAGLVDGAQSIRDDYIKLPAVELRQND